MGVHYRTNPKHLSAVRAVSAKFGRPVVVAKSTDTVQSVTAAMVMDPQHPLNANYTSWLKGAQGSKRKAAEYLRKFPQLRNPVRVAAVPSKAA